MQSTICSAARCALLSLVAAASPTTAQVQLTESFPQAGATAKSAVTAVDVWRACLHPAAFPADSFQTARDLSAVRGAPDPELQHLCNDLILPAGAGEGTRAVWIRWKNAISRRSLPSSQEVQEYAKEVEAALRDWQQRYSEQRGGSLAVQDLAADVIVFAPNSWDIPAADSTKVRHMAATIRAQLESSPLDTVVIYGGADPSGRSIEANRLLADRRAAALLAAVLHADGGLAVYRNRLRTVAVPVVASKSSVERHGLHSAVGAVDPHGREREESRGLWVTDRIAGVRNIPPALLATRARDVPLGTTSITPSADKDLSRTRTQATGSNVSMVSALTDVVIETANAQVHLYMAETVVKDVCNGEKNLDGFRLRRTCGLLSSPSALSFATNLNALRASVREDFVHDFPRVISTYLVDPTSEKISGTQKNQGAVAYYLLSYLPEVASGGDPLRAFEALADSQSVPGWVRESRPGRLISNVRPVLGAYRDARRTFDDLPGSVEVAARDLLLYHFRAGAVQAAGDTLLLPKYMDCVRREAAQSERGPGENGRGRGVEEGLDCTGIVTAASTVVGLVQDVQAKKRRGEFDFASYPPEERIRRAGVLFTDLATVVLTSISPVFSDEEYSALRMVATPARDVIIATSTGEYRTALVHAGTVVLALGDSSQSAKFRLTDRERRMISFAVDLLQAEDQESANDAMRRFVGNGGGYRDKRSGEIDTFWKINAYLGAAYAWEQPTRQEPMDATASNQGEGWLKRLRRRSQATMALPIGLEVGRRWGADGHRYTPRSLSVLAQVLDLGAVAAYRIRKESETAADPDLWQVISPGGYLVMGLGESPAALGVGAAFAPQSRLIRVDTDPEKEPSPELRNAWRFSVFMAVDVPLFP